VIVDVSSFFADAVQSDSTGRIHALGIGWSVIGPAPLPALNLIVHVRAEPGEDGESVELTIRFVDQDGCGVNLPFGPQPFQVTQVTDATPPDQPRASGINPTVVAVLTLPPGLEIAPGPYRFEFTVNGETRDSWYRPFYVRAKPDEYPTPS
jgi:Family of unknown function (DUF6941)